jgi:hypothetical protein
LAIAPYPADQVKNREAAQRRCAASCRPSRSSRCWLLVEPSRVIALVRNAAAAVELEDPAGHLVEEIAVVRDGHDGAGIVFQETLQPSHRLGVEMVRRLVEQQQVGALQEKPAQCHPAPLTARQIGAAGFRTALYAGLDVVGPLYATTTEFGARFRQIATTEGVPAAVRWRSAALPERHLSSETKDVVKLTVALIASMGALVLSLLIASAKRATTRGATS